MTSTITQLAPAATTLTDFYTASGSATVGLITVCNRGATDTTFRISIALLGAADATKQYLAYDAAIKANETLAVICPGPIANTDVVRVYAGTANLSFTAAVQT